MNIGLNAGPRARTVKLGPRHLRTRPDPRCTVYDDDDDDDDDDSWLAVGGWVCSVGRCMNFLTSPDRARLMLA